MHMQQIKLFSTRHRRHFGSKSRSWADVRITDRHHLNFVKVDAFVRSVTRVGRTVMNEMHIMAAFGQVASKLRSRQCLNRRILGKP